MRSLSIPTILGLVLRFRGVLAQFNNSPDFIQTTQVQPPPLASIPDNACTVTLAQHIFANSYGNPSITHYAGPPANCPGPWSNVLLHLKIVSKGVQYDRLGTAWLDDSIVWEFSTAEPSIQTGVFQESYRETVDYSALWSSPRKVTLDIGNVVNDQYTASLNATLTAIFVPGNPADKAPENVIGLSNDGDAKFWSLPSQKASNEVTAPIRNLEKASIEIFSSGNGNEEFWYSNAIDGYDGTFAQQGGQLLGRGPFREVQVLIDGKLAGVAWPFPIIFTGGISPGLWRPLAGIEAYNLPTYEISLDPWLPILADGQAHTFELRALGTNNVPLENWFAAANLKLWTYKDSTEPTTGNITSYSADLNPTVNPNASVGVSNSQNMTLTQKVTASRSISITSEVNIGGYPVTKSWSQQLEYSNTQYIWESGNNQWVLQSTKGTDSTEEGVVFSYDYPLAMNSTFYATSTTQMISASVSRGWNWAAANNQYSPLKAQGNLRTRQDGISTYMSQVGKGSVSSGNSTQTLNFQGNGRGSGVQTYSRKVSVSLGKYVNDDEVLNGHSIDHSGGSRKRRRGTGLLNIVSELLEKATVDVSLDFAPAPIGKLLGRFRTDAGQNGGPGITATL